MIIYYIYETKVNIITFKEDINMNLNKLTELYIYDGSYNDHHTPNYIDGLGYAIPHVKDPKTVTFIENLNVQTSRYHKETVMDHIALVVYNMHRDYGNTFGELAIAIAKTLKIYNKDITNLGNIMSYVLRILGIRNNWTE